MGHTTATMSMLTAAVLAVTTTAVVAVAPPAAATSCAVTWGSLAEVDRDMTSARLTGLRAGRHACFDRLVVDLGPRVAGLPGRDSEGYRVAYVSRVTAPGSGSPVRLAGGAFLHVVVNASAVDDAARPTYVPRDRARAVDVTGFRTFRQVAFVGSYEGATTIGVGVRARLPFRVFVLPGPGAGSRVVIDVAHRW